MLTVLKINDIAKQITDELDLTWVLQLAKTSKEISSCILPIVYERVRLCGENIENIWNADAREAEWQAKRRLDKNLTGCGEWTVTIQSNQVDCPYCSGRGESNIEHNLSVSYMYFPRDLNVLSWYKEDKLIGRTML